MSNDSSQTPRPVFTTVHHIWFDAIDSCGHINPALRVIKYKFTTSGVSKKAGLRPSHYNRSLPATLQK
jgi:hypothetical protein